MRTYMHGQPPNTTHFRMRTRPRKTKQDRAKRQDTGQNHESTGESRMRREQWAIIADQSRAASRPKNKVWTKSPPKNLKQHPPSHPPSHPAQDLEKRQMNRRVQAAKRRARTRLAGREKKKNSHHRVGPGRKTPRNYPRKASALGGRGRKPSLFRARQEPRQHRPR